MGDQFQRIIGIVWVHAATGKVPAAVAEVIPGNATVHVCANPAEWDKKVGRGADFLADRRKLAKDKEQQAGRLGAMPVVLPEGAAYLQGKVLRMLAEGSVVKLWTGRE